MAKKTKKSCKLPDLSNRAKALMTKKNVLERQALKSKLDRRCKFSDDDDPYYFGAAFDKIESYDGKENWVRLLDEGVVLDADKEPYAVIRRGAIKEWYDNLPDDFRGNIDKDHNRSIELGTFGKPDLRIVPIGNERYGVDVNVRLDDELYAVRDLKRLKSRKAISSEFYTSNEEAVKASAIDGKKREYDYYVPIFDEVQITGYGIVEAPMNANSYDDQLLVNASAEQEFSTEEGKDMTDEELKAKAATEAAEAEEKSEEFAAEEATEATEADEAQEVNEAEEVQEAGEATEATEAEEGKSEDFSAQLDKLNEAITSFKAEIAEKDAKIHELETKLAAKEVAKSNFEAKLAKMLDFTTSSDITAEEGGKDTTPENEGDAVLNEYSAAFANLK